jgi:hypothetical protein
MRKRVESGLGSSQNEPCCVHVDFYDFAVFELFCFAENTPDRDVSLFYFRIDNIFELDFSVKDHVEFTHLAFHLS